MTRLDAVARVWGDWMWPMTWQVAALAAAVLVVTLLARRRPAHLRYWLWCLVLVKLCVPPSLAFVTGIGGLLPMAGIGGPLPAEQHAQMVAPAPEAVAAPAPVSPDYLTSAPAVTEAAGPVVAAPQVAVPQTVPAGRLFAAWAAGLLAMAALLALQYVLIRRRLARGSAVTDATALALLEEARAALGVRRRVEMMTVEDMASPVLFGLVRPRIVLPASALALPAEQLRPILLHELAHLKRRDLWVNWVQAVLQSVYWFHPAVWVANGRLRRERELIVDDMVLARLGGEREAYGASLVSVLKHAARRRMLSPGYVGIAEPHGSVAARVRRILDGQRRLSLRLGLAGAALVLALGLVLIPQGRAAQQAPEQAAAPTSPWQATLPNGVTVELVGVSADAKTWWRPDGSAYLDQAPTDSFSMTQSVGVLQVPYFAVRLAAPDPGQIRTRWGFDPAGPSNAVSWYSGLERGGRPAPDMRVVAGEIAPGQKTVTFRAGVLSGDWRVLAGSDGPGVFAGPGYKAITGETIDPKSNDVTVTYACFLEGDLGKNSKTAHRLVVEDTDAIMHIAGWPESSTDGYELQSWRFEGLSRDKVKSILIEVCPYDWVEFRNVSLEPGQKTDVQVVVQAAGAGQQSAPAVTQQPPAPAIAPKLTEQLAELSSVMRGYLSDVTIQPALVGEFGHGLQDWRQWRQQVLGTPHVGGVTPVLDSIALLRLPGQPDYMSNVQVRGVEPDLEGTVSKLPENMQIGTLADLKKTVPQPDGGALRACFVGSMFPGIDAESVRSGTATLILITATKDLERVLAKFAVVGTFKTGYYEYDSRIVIMSLDSAEDFAKSGGSVSGLNVKLDDYHNADAARDELEQKFQDGRVLHTFGSEAAAVASVTLSGDGTRLAGLSGNGQIIVWDVPTGKEVGRVPAAGAAPGAAQTTVAALSSDGALLLVGRQDGSAAVLKTDSGHAVRSVASAASPVTTARFSADDRLFALGRKDGSAGLWQAQGDTPPVMLAGHTGSVNDIVFRPDGDQVATASGDGTAGVWDAASGKRLETLTAIRRAAVLSVAYDPNGDRLLMGQSDGIVVLWDPSASPNISAWPTGGPVHTIFFGPSSNAFLTCTPEGVTGWVMETVDHRQGLRMNMTVVEPTHDLRSVAFAPNGQSYVGVADGGPPQLRYSGPRFSIKTWAEELGQEKDVQVVAEKATPAEPAQQRLASGPVANGAAPGTGTSDAAKQQLMALVDDFFKHNFRDVTARETIEWGDVQTDEKGNRSIRYKYRATIWGKDQMVINETFTFDPAGKFVGLNKIKTIEKGSKDELMSLVVDFFGHNFRDITARKPIEWGDVTRDDKGNYSIRYKYEATIWDKDVMTMNQVFTFDAKGEFVKYENVAGYPQKVPGTGTPPPAAEPSTDGTPPAAVP